VSLNSFITAYNNRALFDTVDFLTVFGGGPTEFYLNLHNYGGGYVNLAVYSSVANVQSALTEFLTIAGPPWFAVGNLANIADASPQNYQYPIAVYLPNIVSMQDTGIGMTFNDIANPYMPSFGYAPFADFASAQSVLMPLAAGTYTFVGE
jgi:hypothetical protein